MSRRTDLEFLDDIVDRIKAAKIAERFLIESEGDLLRTAFDAILYDLLVIGEAVKKLNREITERNGHVPWKAIAGMRDVLAHDYFRVFADVVRTTLDETLEILKAVCLSELSRIRKGSSAPNAR